MLLRPLTNGSVSGTGTITLQGRLLGGVLVTTNNTNAVTITVQRTDSSGTEVFDLSTLSPGFHVAPIDVGASVLYYNVSGTGGAAQFFEWVE
jgi:hypothetical protein